MFNGMIASDRFATFWKWLFLGAGGLTVLIAARSNEFTRRASGSSTRFCSRSCSACSSWRARSTCSCSTSRSRWSRCRATPWPATSPATAAPPRPSLKYVIYGGVASGIMLFGLSYIYGLTGSTNLIALGVRLDSLAAPAAAGGQAGLRVALMVAVIFVLCGIGYKIAAVPWHMWCPDVYEGAPTPFTAFLSVGPKAAGFALAMRVFYSALASGGGSEGFARGLVDVPWPAVVGVLSAVTMTLGNFTALHQNELEAPARLLVDLARRLRPHGARRRLAPRRAERDDLHAGLPGDEPRGLPRGHRHRPGHRLGDHRRLQGPGAPPPLAGRDLRRLPLLADRAAAARRLHRQVVPLRGRPRSLRRAKAAAGTSPSPSSPRSTPPSRSTTTCASSGPCSSRRPSGELVVRPKVSYQIMLGAFSAALLLFGIWWNPIVDWTKWSLAFMQRG